MTKNVPSLLILEDTNDSRELLETMFTDRGFRTFSAESTARAHELISAHPNEFDVLILDMHLNEPKTGADFGIEVRGELLDSSPEFLIQSEFQRVDYYHLALKLGAAVYLDRNEPDEPRKLVRHTRALALRHGLRPGRPGITEEIKTIASASRNKSEANTRLCRDLLVPQLRRTTGCGFVLLLSDEVGTRAFWSTSDEPERGEIYDTLQKAVFGNLRYGDPQLVDTGMSSPLGILNGRLNYIEASQKEIPFLRLAEIEGVRLSLGLFDERAPSSRLPENALELARILGRYVRPAVIHHLLETAVSDLEWQKRAIASASGSFCFYVGREIVNLLENVEREQRNEGSSSDALLALRGLGEELKESGELLNALAVPAEAGMPAHHGGVFDAGDLIRDVWQDLIGRGQIDAAHRLEVGGDQVTVRRADLFQGACHRILLWLDRRTVDYPPDSEPVVRVFIERTPTIAIRFEDGSLRLPKQFRTRLFAPFFTPYLEPVTDRRDKGRRFGLFLARTLVEAQGGTFEDRSDDLPGEEIGHRLVIRFPPAP